MKQLIALALVVTGLSGCAGVQGSNAPAPDYAGLRGAHDIGAGAA